MLQRTENVIASVVQWLGLIAESLGALVIAVAIVGAVIGLLRMAISRDLNQFHHIRLSFAHWLVLALEFHLAADILGTMIAPTWEQIQQLAAIAAIRTGLSYFLYREAKAEQAELRAEVEREVLGS